MTNLHDIMRLHGTQLSNQQLADMALQEDQAARRARRAGRDDEAESHQLRADALAGMLQ
jgi:hypothetical protein